MDERQRLFRAVKELYEAVKECPEAAERVRKYAVNGISKHSKPKPIFSTEWIQCVNALLPYTEKALDEQRRFMRAQRNVVRVDKAKQVTSETVRHLAQHTEYITRVDKNDCVQPDRLMTVEREENYAIYENRFLYTLVMQLDRFLSQKEHEYKQIASSRSFVCGIENDGKSNGVHIESRINRMDDEALEPVLPKEWKGLRRKVSEMMRSPLIRMLNKTAPVRYPIVRTNMIKKNINFQKSLELFEFMLQQQKGLIDVEQSSVTDEDTPELLEVLGAIAALAEEVAGLGADKGAWEEAEKLLKQDDECRRIEQLEEEQRRQREIDDLIQAARAEEIAIKQAEIIRRESEFEALRNELAAMQSREAALNRRLAQYKDNCLHSLLKLENELVCLCAGLDCEQGRKGSL